MFVLRRGGNTNNAYYGVFISRPMSCARYSQYSRLYRSRFLLEKCEPLMRGPGSSSGYDSGSGPELGSDSSLAPTLAPAPTWVLILILTWLRLYLQLRLWIRLRLRLELTLILTWL